MIRTANIRVFRDTMRACESHDVLKSAIEKSIAAQRVIPEALALDALPEGEREGRIILSRKRSFEAAFAHCGKRVCVLNFASSINPGGGVVNGSSAQEESLCRCSTLYPCLNSDAAWEGFYLPHRADKNPLHSNDCIYTPDVIVFKEDSDYPQSLPEDKWTRADIITCAAPNLRALREMGGELSDEALFALHEGRMRRILHIAALGGNDVLILGAFGCGAFGNDPEIVAPALNAAVRAYRRHFRIIEFPVFCRGGNDANFHAFEKHIQL